MLEKRGGRCRTDGPIRVLFLPDAAHDSCNQGRCVEPPLGVRPTLPAARGYHSLQQSLNPWSRTQSAATDGSPACCTSSLMLRVCVMLRVPPSQSSVRSLLVLLLYNSGAGPGWPVLFGALEAVLPRTNARCVVGQ